MPIEKIGLQWGEAKEWRNFCSSNNCWDAILPAKDKMTWPAKDSPPSWQPIRKEYLHAATIDLDQRSLST
jgi:hypothetical protein